MAGGATEGREKREGKRAQMISYPQQTKMLTVTPIFGTSYRHR